MVKLVSKDLVAGTVVFLVALPLCLGIALASGAPLIAGLVSGIIGGIIVGFLSGSQTSVSGPAAGLTAVVATQIASLGSFEAFLLALMLAGLFQIGLGLARGGFIAAFFPSSVIKGLLAAIGVILVLKQLPHLVGWDADFNGEMAFWQKNNENTFSELLHLFEHVHKGAMLVGVLSFLLLIFWDKIAWLKKSSFPAPLAVVCLALFVSPLLGFLGTEWLIDMKHLVQVPDLQGSSLGSLFARPDFSQLMNPAIFTSALVLAAVASLETLLNLEAVDRIDPLQRRSPPNRELVAQGVGNVALGFLGGLPVTSVVIRSSVNLNAGGRTKLAAIWHGVLLLLCLLFLASYINLIPLSCLAAVLIVTGLKLVSDKVIKQMWNLGATQFVPFATTLVAIVFTDLLVGVAIGLAVSALFILHSNLRRPVKVIKERHFDRQIARITLANQVSFLNKAALLEALESLQKGEHVIFDATHTDYMDADIIDLIADFRDNTATARGIEVSFVGFNENHALSDQIRFAEFSTQALRQELTPSQVLRVLKDGNDRIREGKRLNRDLARQISGTAPAQFPIGAFLSCMDSRVPVEVVFDLGIGDVFSTRIAGHVISDKVLGSLEFACAIAGAKLIVVMGHTRCGAVSAAIDFYKSGEGIGEKTGCEHLPALVEDLQKLLKQKGTIAFGEKGSPQREQLEDLIVRENVSESIDAILSRSATLKKLVDEGRIAIVGCIYDVKNGAIEFTREIRNAPQEEQTDKALTPSEALVAST